MKPPARRLLCMLLAAAPWWVSPAMAAGYPDHAVRLIVPQPPGGPADATGRLLAQKLSDAWGVPVVVDNRPGADMQIAGSAVARAAPDGYTLMLASVTFTMSKGLYATLPYDPVRDFVPISGFTTSPLLLVTAASNPAKNLPELLADARAHPDRQTYASVSSLNHIGGEMLKKLAGIQALHVPYKGSAASVIAVSTGETTWTLDSLATVRPLMDGKRLKVLGVTGPARLPQLPDVPTLAESGLADFSLSSWFGVMAPAGTDPVIVRKINADMQTVMANAETQQRMRDFGMSPMPGSVEWFSALVKSEFVRYEALVKANGLQVSR